MTMTDKQIIIDGECLRCGAKTKKHILVCEKCTEEMGTVIAHKFTIDKQTREIKQLKKQLLRKEQECEELKKQLESTKGLVTVGNRQFVEALKENKELHSLVELIKTDLMKSDMENDDLRVENEKLIQTLAEIKDIAEKQCNICESITPIDEYKDCKNCWQGVILQKINECEINNEC